MLAVQVLLFLVAWVGHACIWTRLLNALYGMAITKKFLRPFRLFTGLMIVFGFPAYCYAVWEHETARHRPFWPGPELVTELFYPSVCLVIGGVYFPLITFLRLGSPRPPLVTHESSRLLPLWEKHGTALVGDGTWRHVARLPLNDPFTVEFSDITLSLEQLPPALDGLTILHLSDFHFCGTPSRLYFEAILYELGEQPVPDLVALGGDYVDTFEHHAWLELLGRLKWNVAGLAVLGNHDTRWNPDGVRSKLATLGYKVLSNRSEGILIRGESCEVIGHEGPWVTPPPLLQPSDAFRICVSHTPDNFYWAVQNRIDLVLCGHVHGGQIRLPVIGSIFCPSIYGRRFDQGVFEREQTAMVVSRGISGKEPLRYRCRPQAIRITLTR